MRILYGIQGTGNGHIGRALELLPLLQRRGTVDILFSGSQAQLNKNWEAKYRFKGLGYFFGESGNLDWLKTLINFSPINLIREIRSLPIQNYDLILTDFEPISSWAAKKAKRVCIGIGSVYATLHALAPIPREKSIIGKSVLKYYSPTTVNFAMHFRKLDENVYTPIIRKDIRNALVCNKGHFTVYLPSYSDRTLVSIFQEYKHIKWEVFSRFAENTSEHSNIRIIPIDSHIFVESLASSSGVITNAGFGVCSEALYLGKKLMAIPMRRQYEQYCNAAMLKDMGVFVAHDITKKNKLLQAWIDSYNKIDVDYPDQTEMILDRIVEVNFQLQNRKP